MFETPGTPKLSKRAEQVWALCHSSESWNPDWIPEGARNDKILCLHQATLAQQLGCSRWTIGRAIKRLKEEGLLVEIGRDKKTRCKTYALQAPSPLGGEGFGVRFSIAMRTPHPSPLPQGERESNPTPQGLVQLQNYRHLFECTFKTWPNWETHYSAVTWNLKDVTDTHKLWRQTCDSLYEIQQRETGDSPLRFMQEKVSRS